MPAKPLLPPYLPAEERFRDGWGKPRKVLEKDMRRDIINLAVKCGFEILDLEPGVVASGKTKLAGKVVLSTPGAPDLILMDRHPNPGILWAIQVKGFGTGHKESPQQQRFGRLWEANGGKYTVGTLVEFEEALVQMGRATRQDRKQRAGRG